MVKVNNQFSQQAQKLEQTFTLTSEQKKIVNDGVVNEKDLEVLKALVKNDKGPSDWLMGVVPLVMRKLSAGKKEKVINEALQTYNQVNNTQLTYSDLKS